MCDLFEPAFLDMMIAAHSVTTEFETVISTMILGDMPPPADNLTPSSALYISCGENGVMSPKSEKIISCVPRLIEIPGQTLENHYSHANIN